MAHVIGCVPLACNTVLKGLKTPPPKFEGDVIIGGAPTVIVNGEVVLDPPPTMVTLIL